MKRKILITLLIVVILATSVLALVGCTKTKVATHNIQKGADNFQIYRRMTFINLRTDKILYEAEGYFSLQDTREGGSEIGLTFMIGPGEYKLDYFSIDANVAYVIEQVENTTMDPYHWHIYWYVSVPESKLA